MTKHQHGTSTPKPPHIKNATRAESHLSNLLCVYSKIS
ncbi:unknow [Vibrio parahaemolyticus]|nr:unknow [Vibrio parahaemolyticus]